MGKVLTVRDIMIKDVLTISTELTVKEVIEFFYQHGFSGAPVVDQAGNLVAVISEKDLYAALYPKAEEAYQDDGLVYFSDPEAMEDRLKDSGDKKIKEIIGKKVMTTTPDEPAIFVGAKMIAERINRLPVMENDKIVGIISRRDVYQAIFKHLFNFKI
jgi:CBS domain-containing protein